VEDGARGEGAGVEMATLPLLADLHGTIEDGARGEGAGAMQ
jgi:hypothetical protein